MGLKDGQKGRGSRAIVVDDQNPMRKALLKLLEELEFEVAEFMCARDAIQYLAKNTVELVVSDIYMPRETGFDILHYVRSRPMANDIPVIFVTGEATKEDIVHSVEQGVTEYVLKPFEREDFLSKVQHVLEKYRNPSEQELQVRRAENFFLNGQYKEARDAFREVLVLSDIWSSRILVGMAQAEAKLGNLEEAMSFLQQSIQDNSKYHHAFSVAADIHLEKGKISEAVRFMLRELEIYGRQPLRRVQLADILNGMGDSEQALEQLKLGLAASPRNEAVVLKLAEIYAEAGNTDKAVHFYLKARRQNPQCTKALDGVVKVYLQAGTPKNAIHLLTDMHRANPQLKDVLLTRARVYAKIGDLEKSLEDVEVFLASQKAALEGLQLKVKLLSKMGRESECIELLAQICNLNPTGENYGKLGLAYLKIKSYRSAVECYEKALLCSPDEPKFCFNLAYSYEQLGNLSKALQSYRSVIEYAPGEDQALEAQKRIKRVKELLAMAPSAGGAGEAAPKSQLDPVPKQRRLVS